MYFTWTNGRVMNDHNICVCVCGNAQTICILRRPVREVTHTLEIKGLYHCYTYGRNRLSLCLVNKGPITAIFFLLIPNPFLCSHHNCQQLLLWTPYCSILYVSCRIVAYWAQRVWFKCFQLCHCNSTVFRLVWVIWVSWCSCPWVILECKVWIALVLFLNASMLIEFKIPVPAQTPPKLCQSNHIVIIWNLNFVARIWTRH